MNVIKVDCQKCEHYELCSYSSRVSEIASQNSQERKTRILALEIKCEKFAEKRN